MTDNNTQADTSSFDIVAFNPINAVTVFGTSGGSESVIDAIKKQVEGLVLDISTDKGRKEIASVAYKIARTKTALDDEGKKLKADMQKTVDLVDAERKKIRDALDVLKDEVRKPLTEWEDADKIRTQTREDRITAIIALSDFGLDQVKTVDLINNRIEQLASLVEFDWQEFVMRAESTASQVKVSLAAMLDKQIKDDADKAELERLRKEQEVRQQKERDDRIAAEAAAKAKQEAEEKAERDRVAAQEEADRKQREAEQRAADEKARADKAEADRIASEKKAADDKIAADNAAKIAKEKADADAKAAADKAAQDERDRAAAAKKAEDDAAAKRAADVEHKKKINGQALAGITKLGVSEEHAKAIVIAIAKGEIPNVTIKY